ncbi:hypothetical protein C7271_03705 [filamentous cyanobacterium CCP5]|nr:hypothetical protein C7271_03705 [filamentous cyanobacterium CCP5]
MAVIATMHHKEQAIAPRLEAALGVKTLVPADFNTDTLGTFTRDMPRPGDQITTARLKAEAALDLTGATLAIASEGSFGPHPQIPWVPCDRELVLLGDRQHNLEIMGQVISTDTNYRSQIIRSIEDAFTFAQAIGFPDHGLVVMAADNPQPATVIAKGIVTGDALQEAVSMALTESANGTAHIETDMRALYNPTRMEVIAQATEDLLKAIARRCPDCGCPGFREVKRYPGLPCGLCRTPTRLTLAVVYGCQRCQAEQEERYPEGQPTADPAQCPYCNP